MIILDTNVVSEVMNRVASPAVLKWWSSQKAEQLYTTSITVAEILYGIEILPRGRRRTQLEAGAEALFSKVLAGHILAFDDAAARSFATIGAKRRIKGRPINEMDLQIAAVAYLHRASIATRNTRDFEECGIELIDPWNSTRT